MRLHLLGQGDVQAVGEKGDEDVRLDTVLELVVDRAYCKVALEIFERLLDLYELNVVALQLGRVGAGQVGTQQIAPFAAAHFAQLVAAQGVGEGGGAIIDLYLNQPPGRR